MCYWRWNQRGLKVPTSKQKWKWRFPSSAWTVLAWLELFVLYSMQRAYSAAQSITGCFRGFGGPAQGVKGSGCKNSRSTLVQSKLALKIMHILSTISGERLLGGQTWQTYGTLSDWFVECGSFRFTRNRWRVHCKHWCFSKTIACGTLAV